MKSNPKKDSNKEQTSASSPSGDTLPVVKGSDKPVDKPTTPANESGGTNQPPGQNNNLTEPDGPNSKKKKWTRDDTFRVLTLIISTGGLMGTIWALTNTTKTLNANREQFEISNRPFIEMVNIKIDSTQQGEKPIISYDLTNKGRFPALVTNFKSFIGVATSKTTADDIVKAAESTIANLSDTNVGIIPFAPSLNHEVVQSQVPLTKDQTIAVSRGEFFYTLTVEIKYVNLVTKAPYFYIQIMKTPPKGGVAMTAMRYHDDPQ